MFSFIVLRSAFPSLVDWVDGEDFIIFDGCFDGVFNEFERFDDGDVDNDGVFRGGGACRCWRNVGDARDGRGEGLRAAAFRAGVVWRAGSRFLLTLDASSAKGTDLKQPAWCTDSSSSEWKGRLQMQQACIASR